MGASMRLLATGKVSMTNTRTSSACADGFWCRLWPLWGGSAALPSVISSRAEPAPVRSRRPCCVAELWRHRVSAQGKGVQRSTHHTSRGAACEWRCRSAMRGGAVARWRGLLPAGSRRVG